MFRKDLYIEIQLVFMNQEEKSVVLGGDDNDDIAFRPVGAGGLLQTPGDLSRDC